MFVIIENDNVILGPKRWNKLAFEDCLLEDCDISFTLPSSNDNNEPIIVSDTIKILHVVALPQPNYNGKIQRLDGPYWNFTDTTAEMYFGIADLDIDAVKNMLKTTAANNRYAKEVSGIKYLVQEQEVTVDTARGSRDIFLQTYLAMADNELIEWKFPEGWFSLAKWELGGIVGAGKKHIQDCFAWEQTKGLEIDSKTTLAELDAIDLEVII